MQTPKRFILLHMWAMTCTSIYMLRWAKIVYSIICLRLICILTPRAFGRLWVQCSACVSHGSGFMTTTEAGQASSEFESLRDPIPSRVLGAWRILRFSLRYVGVIRFIFSCSSFSTNRVYDENLYYNEASTWIGLKIESPSLVELWLSEVHVYWFRKWIHRFS